MQNDDEYVPPIEDIEEGWRLIKQLAEGDAGAVREATPAWVKPLTVDTRLVFSGNYASNVNVNAVNTGKIGVHRQRLCPEFAGYNPMA